MLTFTVKTKELQTLPKWESYVCTEMEAIQTSIGLFESPPSWSPSKPKHSNWLDGMISRLSSTQSLLKEYYVHICIYTYIYYICIVELMGVFEIPNCQTIFEASHEMLPLHCFTNLEGYDSQVHIFLHRPLHGPGKICNFQQLLCHSLTQTTRRSPRT